MCCASSPSWRPACTRPGARVMPANCPSQRARNSCAIVFLVSSLCGAAVTSTCSPPSSLWTPSCTVCGGCSGSLLPLDPVFACDVMPAFQSVVTSNFTFNSNTQSAPQNDTAFLRAPLQLSSLYQYGCSLLIVY